MANSQAKIMGEVTQTVRFCIERLKNDLVEKRVELNLTEDQVRNVSNLAEASIQSAYNRAMDQIMNAIE